MTTCDGPLRDGLLPNTNDNKAKNYDVNGPSGGTNCEEALVRDDDKDTRTIEEKFRSGGFTNHYEGQYVVIITGWNSVYPTNVGETKIIWDLHADCFDTTTANGVVISGPTTIFSDP